MAANIFDLLSIPSNIEREKTEEENKEEMMEMLMSMLARIEENTRPSFAQTAHQGGG